METLVKTVDLGVPLEPEDGLASGSLAGRWRIEHELGRGGMGIVYAVVHADIGKRAALKILHRRLFASSEHCDRVLTEARVVNQIDHPGIVDIFDTGTLADGRSYIVMERLDGCSLAHHAATTKIRPAHAIEMLLQICDALAAAHTVGVLHRDLKPDNVFLVDEPTHRIKLLDWGIAKVIAQEVSTTREGQLAGTPQYVSPEQARGMKLTPKSDIYSLGVMAYHLLLGSLPFESTSAVEILAMHLHVAPPLPRDLWPDIPRPLEALLLAILAKQPDDRPSLSEVARRLAAIRVELLAQPAPPSAPASAARRIAPAATATNDDPHQRGRWRYVVGAASLAALALLLVLAREDTPDTELAPAATTSVSEASPASTGAANGTSSAAISAASAASAAPSAATSAAAGVSSAIGASGRASHANEKRFEATRSTREPTGPKPPAAAPPKYPNAEAVVAKYATLGRELGDAPRQRELSELWSRYRRLQIQEALATPEKRAQAAALLDRLAADLAARRPRR